MRKNGERRKWTIDNRAWQACAIFYCLFSPLAVFASTGTEGASFLDIPVGAGPAALGGAYTARATDAYAPTWNPGGLGFLDAAQVAGQHVSYLGNAHYEYLSGVMPLRNGRSIGASLQYLGSGNITGADIYGNPTGDFSASFASYNLAYGQRFNDQWALGMTGKWIHASLDSVSANAFAVDFGTLYRPMERLSLGATLTNIGSQLTFLSDGDQLPLALHLGAAYNSVYHVDGLFELVHERSGQTSVHMGAEWHLFPYASWRVGFHTDALSGLSPLAGFTTGIGMTAWGYEFSYAWVPYGDLGNTQYFSLLLRFGETSMGKRNLIQYKSARPSVHQDQTAPENEERHQGSEPDNLMQMLNKKDAEPSTDSR